MKTLLTGLLLSALASHTYAKPSQAVVDACLRTGSESAKVRYTALPADAFQVTEDEDAGKTETTLRHGKDVVGVWEVKPSQAFGLVYNGKETPLHRVTRLDKQHAPEAFDPYKAMWGEAREGAKSYICITFNFEGLGQSGSFQNVRGLYLIEKKSHHGTPFYTVGNIGSTKK